jgi:DNA invertase Pin-like site-specific DNA recombinase
MEGKFVAYYRVSTVKQGDSGLGLEAQKETVNRYLNGGSWELLTEFIEIETGKGSNALSKRPKLKEAMELCLKKGATLIIAKLDRLARNVHFVSGLIESKVNFVAADMPHANKVMIQMHAVMSEWERDQISNRTKQALKIKKEELAKVGKKLGNPNLKASNDIRLNEAVAFAENLRPTLESFKSSGMTQRVMVAELNKLGVKTSRGSEWSLIQLQRVISRLS